MNTGATPEQIEAAAKRLHDRYTDYESAEWPCDDCLAEVRRWMPVYVPEGSSIIRADENYLTPELRAALARVVPIARAAYRYDLQEQRDYLEKVEDNDFTILADLLAEAER